MSSSANLPLCESKEALHRVIKALVKITERECPKRTYADTIVDLLTNQYPQLSEEDAAHLTDKVITYLAYIFP